MNQRFRPSAHPAIAQCPQYEGDSIERDYSELGTKRHEALKMYNEEEGLTDAISKLDPESQEGVIWASDYINTHTRATPVWEQTIAIGCGAEGDGIKGTPDATDNIANIFDFKWRIRDYKEQMAAYALGIMQANWLPAIKCHLLFGESKKAVTHYFTFAEAQKIVNDTIKFGESGAPPNPCDYCNWCGKVKDCPAMLERANAITAAREDWKLEQYHSSEIQSPEDMSKALRLAREISKWCEAVEYHAKQLAVMNNGLPGYKIQERKGKRVITDISNACKLSGIDPDKFIEACTVSMTKLEDLYLETADFTSKAAAKRELNEKLAAVIDNLPSSKSLVKEKTPKE